MTLLESRLAATEEKIKELKAARKAADRVRRQSYAQSKADQARKIELAGEAVLRAVESGRWNEADFLELMNDTLHRPADRALFNLDQ